MRSDWLPRPREHILSMAHDWMNVMSANASAWGIPAGALTELDSLMQTAEAALATAQNETTRTTVATAQCKAAFEELTANMRDIKKRYFLAPPLDDPAFISLSLKPHDSTYSPTGSPTSQVTGEIFLIGRHELGVKIIYITGSPDDRANKGFRVWYKAVAHGETPPASPEELTKSFFTHRRRDVIAFDFADSGKTAHCCIQVENDGRKGPWGPLFSAVIP